MALCTHFPLLANLNPPKLSQSVHREECTQCFDNQDLPSGIDVCLTCFNGGCLDEERHHAQNHFRKSGHGFTLNVKRTIRPTSVRGEDQEPPAKMTKLAIVQDRTEAEKYEHITQVKCWKCDPVHGIVLQNAEKEPSVKVLLDGIMNALSSARKSVIEAWEEEIFPCEHTLTLVQEPKGHIADSALAHCNQCELNENLWLCLVCGNLGCGRKQFGGEGGNGHGLAHFEQTNHGVSVKLGTITPEGGADAYCYICNDSKTDPEIAAHLATFGINLRAQKKTEKNMTELQIEQNMAYEFSLTGEDGKALEPISGPGLTGLANLGNSCYMASVLQTLFSLPEFQSRYYSAISAKHAETCDAALPAECVECQMIKMADGLLSGRYAKIAEESEPASTDGTRFQVGMKPAGFKTLIGKGHEEFATMRQQDSEEFFTHLMTVLRRYIHAHPNVNPGEGKREPTELFAFGMEQRLECSSCRGVRYRTDGMDVVSISVPARKVGDEMDEDGKETGRAIWGEVEVEECFARLMGEEGVDGYVCPVCQTSVGAIKRTRFATFPDVLVLHAKKFQLLNWVPTKLDIPLILPASDELVLDAYLGQGLQPGEKEITDETSSSESGLPAFNKDVMGQLEAMGFSTLRSQKALLATGNSDAEAAMEWLFTHLEDPDIDDPIHVGGGKSQPEPNPESVGALSDMGFTAAQAKKALKETNGDAERAVEWLFSHPDDNGEEVEPSASGTKKPSLGGRTDLPARYRLKAFISHKGRSVHSGHYVAHVRDPGEGNVGWVLFNDEKVVKADAASVDELKKLAYLYVFERV